MGFADLFRPRWKHSDPTVRIQAVQNLESQTQKRRSRSRTLGRFTDLRRTASCWRSARFSRARAAWDRIQDRKTERMNARRCIRRSL